MTPGTVVPQEETAHNGDASLGERVESDQDGQHDCQDDDGCAALACAASPREHDRGAPGQHGDGEEHAAGPREPKPPPQTKSMPPCTFPGGGTNTGNVSCVAGAGAG